MKATEILKNVKELLSASKEEIAVEETVVLASEEVQEEVVEQEKEIELAEEVESKEPIVEEKEVSYATIEEVSSLRSELISMIKAIIDDKPNGESNQVPEELSSQEEVELAEEVVHSPESSVEKKQNLLSNQNKNLSIQERVNKMLFN